VSEGDSVRKAKKELGEVGPVEPAATPGAAPNPTLRAAPGDVGVGGDKSVESMLQEFSSVGADATGAGGAPRGKYDQLWQLSMADPHTGLANQLLLLDRLTLALARRRRHGGEVVVCRIDLHNLDEINLDFGYTVGNAALCEIARRLTAVLRAEDTVARVGESELVVVVAVTDEHVVTPLLRRLQHTLDEPVAEAGMSIRLQSCLGVAVAEDAESAEDVLARAERSTRVSRR
jgi:diguanylate cyclase (GGDEF)-like protein